MFIFVNRCVGVFVLLLFTSWIGCLGTTGVPAEPSKEIQSSEPLLVESSVEHLTDSEPLQPEERSFVDANTADTKTPEPSHLEPPHPEISPDSFRRDSFKETEPVADLPSDAGVAEVVPEPQIQNRPVIVAVGYGGRRITSFDLGQTWTHNAQLKPKGVDDYELLRCVVFAKGRFVTFGWRGFHSVDGKTWTEFHRGWKDKNKPSPLQYKAGSGWRGGIVYGNGRFVAVGGPYASVSTDGKNWSSHSMYASDPWSHSHTRHLVFGKGLFVAIGDKGLRIRSKDGQTWTDERTGGATIHAITYGNGWFVAVGASGRITRSSDGKTWLEQTVPEDLGSVVFTTKPKSQFIAFSRTGIYTSFDGKKWTKTAVKGGMYSGVQWFGGFFLATRWGGQIFRSNDGKKWTEVFNGKDNSITEFALGHLPFP